MLPDKIKHVAVNNITSTSAKVFWSDPETKFLRGQFVLSRFRIKLSNKNNLTSLSITTGKVNEYVLHNLSPYTTYEVSVAAGNEYGFGEEMTSLLFLTPEDSEWREAFYNTCIFHEFFVYLLVLFVF